MTKETECSCGCKNENDLLQSEVEVGNEALTRRCALTLAEAQAVLEGGDPNTQPTDPDDTPYLDEHLVDVLNGPSKVAGNHDPDVPTLREWDEREAVVDWFMNGGENE